MFLSLPKYINVFLVGPMGAGKTTIGRQLAKALKSNFVDSDHEIAAHTGVSIPLIFEIEGESGFRKRESDIIDELTCRKGVVLATGGGAVLAQENREHLKTRGVVVYLRADVDELFTRTSKDKNRPLLQTDDPKAKLAAIIAERAPLYTDVADIVMDTSRKDVRSIVRELAGRTRRVGRQKFKKLSESR